MIPSELESTQGATLAFAMQNLCEAMDEFFEDVVDESSLTLPGYALPRRRGAHCL